MEKNEYRAVVCAILAGAFTICFCMVQIRGCSSEEVERLHLLREMYKAEKDHPHAQ